MDFVEVRRHEIEMEYQMFQNNRKQLFGDTAVVDKQNVRHSMVNYLKIFHSNSLCIL